MDRQVTTTRISYIYGIKFIFASHVYTMDLRGILSSLGLMGKILWTFATLVWVT